MKTLDDAWNSQDWDTFNKRHSEGKSLYTGQVNLSQQGDDRIINLNLLNFSRLFQTIVLIMIHTRYYLAKVTGHVR